MIIIGGITRLTHSGLSIVEWDLFSEIPLFPTEAQWHQIFEKYKQSPEFKYINADFTLSEFKSIFWWEYVHRMWGRLIGVVFILPYIYFSYKGLISKAIQPKMLILLALGGFQGFLGWFMVKSGLVHEPAVSHYRLAAHLITAFLTCSYIYWIILSIKDSNVQTKPLDNMLISWSLFGIILLIQIMLGAFVAGLKAGFILNTFPDMGGVFMPDFLSDDTLSKMITTPIGVQFAHRISAYLLFAIGTYMWFTRKSKPKAIQLEIKHTYALLIIQVLLGILTLIYRVPLILGLAHQLCAFILLLQWVKTMYTTCYLPTTKELV